jgi:hypothetical protein
MKKISTPTDGNAMKWAEAFVAYQKAQNWTVKDMDRDLMLGWFANAIEAGRNELRKDENRKALEAIGCTYATMCEIQLRSHLYGFPDGKDITQIEFPEIAENVQKALGMEAKG